MTNDLIKINLKNVDCKNIYFDNRNGIFGTKEITKAPTYIGCDFKLYLRVYAVDESGNKKQTKKSFSFSNKITFLQAINVVKDELKNDLYKLIDEPKNKYALSINCFMDSSILPAGTSLIPLNFNVLLTKFPYLLVISLLCVVT